jgi:hypothetical protein
MSCHHIANNSHSHYLPSTQQEIRLMVIPFPAHTTSCPNRTGEAGSIDSVLPVAMPWWVEAHRGGFDPIPRLRQAFGSIGASDVAFSIGALMTIIARAVRRPVAIHSQCCPNVSADEGHLFHAAGLVQAGSGHLAEKVLRTALLSAEGAAFAIGPPEGLGELFAEARLILTWRAFPAQDPDSIGGPESCSPPPQTLH